MAQRQSDLIKQDRFEKCAECDNDTGFAGAGEDSIFCSCDDHVGGPYCEPCNKALHPELQGNSPDNPCYDCGSTISLHHTPLCDLAEDNAIKDLPAIPNTQYWTKENK